jgi:transketolase C-terminal domain/subunit
VKIRFDTLEEATAFADKHGLDYTVVEPHAHTEKAKSYADNFRYDRVRAAIIDPPVVRPIKEQ